MKLGLIIFSTILILISANPSLDEIFVFIDFFGPQDFYTGIGDVNFIISTKSKVAQQYFNQGIALLHSFWPFEALRSFRQVILADSNCSMGYYGVFKALQWDTGYIRGRSESLSIANTLSKNASEREQLYIIAENGDFQWYNETFQKIFKNYPNDLEAKIIWAWNVIDYSVTIFGNPKSIRSEAQELLNTLAISEPENFAIHHYIIHAWEDTFYPQNALNSSLIIESFTPASHISHMPGHIYYLLGDYSTAHNVFLNSYHSDLEYGNKYNIGFENNWEIIHNLAFLVINLGAAGRYREAIHYALEVQSLEQKNPQVQVLDFNPHTSAVLQPDTTFRVCVPCLFFTFSILTGKLLMQFFI